jgi:hypothetical protein
MTEHEALYPNTRNDANSRTGLHRLREGVARAAQGSSILQIPLTHTSGSAFSGYNHFPAWSGLSTQGNGAKGLWYHLLGLCVWVVDSHTLYTPRCAIRNAHVKRRPTDKLKLNAGGGPYSTTGLAYSKVGLHCLKNSYSVAGCLVWWLLHFCISIIYYSPVKVSRPFQDNR